MAATVKKKGVSAKDQLQKQRGQRPKPEDPTATIDIGSFMMDVTTSKKLDTNIGELVETGSILRTMDGASHIDVTMRDQQRIMLRSGILSLVVDLTYGRRHWRLAQNQKQGSDLSMSYEDRVIALLRTKSDPRTASRGKMTRAEFVRMLVRSIKAYNIDFFCPELHKIQPIDSKKDKNERKKKKQPGLEKSTALTILGHTANKQQVDNAETILDIGYHMRANRKVLVAALMTAMDESTLINVQHGDAVGPDSIGVFQQRASWGPLSQRKTVAGASKLFFKVAIEIDKAHSDWTLWELCTAVQFPAYRSKPSGQIPSFGLRYDRFKKEAKVWVDEYGATGGDTSFTRTKRFQFTVGPPDGPDGENYWQAITRLAEEVNWRAFVHNILLCPRRLSHQTEARVYNQRRNRRYRSHRLRC
jgi:hypothetical protein